jgi:RimJ/RimL family protein N-acetyltransferase
LVNPLDGVSWPVRTERLTLRRSEAADAAAVWRYRRLPEVNRWLPSAQTGFDEFHEYFNAPHRLDKTLVIELDGVVIGDLMVKVQDGWAQTEVASQAQGVQAELGWSLDPAYGGRGYATEAVSALLRICFEQLGLRRVTAECFSDNTASWRLMERLGMRREAHAVRDSLHRSGEWLDGYTYAMLRDEWAAP